MLKNISRSPFSKKGVVIPSSNVRKQHNNTAAPVNWTDDNLLQRNTNYYDLLNTNNTYRISFMFLIDIVLVNQPIKNNPIICTLETRMIKSFESKKQAMTLSTSSPDVKVKSMTVCSVQ